MKTIIQGLMSIYFANFYSDQGSFQESIWDVTSLMVHKCVEIGTDNIL